MVIAAPRLNRHQVALPPLPRSRSLLWACCCRCHCCAIVIVTFLFLSLCCCRVVSAVAVLMSLLLCCHHCVAVAAILCLSAVWPYPSLFPWGLLLGPGLQTRGWSCGPTFPRSENSLSCQRGSRDAAAEAEPTDGDRVPMWTAGEDGVCRWQAQGPERRGPRGQAGPGHCVPNTA